MNSLLGDGKGRGEGPMGAARGDTDSLAGRKQNESLGNPTLVDEVGRKGLTREALAGRM